ncbi:MAG TPA: glycosyltransferase N-terminal domain-containing protein [Caulobacteraceae bacterium]|nr:glycosyltransferase N-terminal domain-containing protein [Caulobacteraceae bacterium]
MTPRRPLSLRAYGLAAAALAPLVPSLLAARARRGKEDVGRLGERLGRPGLERPAGPLVWMHGASVGEGLSFLPLIVALRERRPDLAILVTTGTRASARLLAERLPLGAVHQYAPVDTPAAVDRFLTHWRPDLAVFVESELWPNLIWAARRGGARLALVSARMSAASAATWRRFPAAARAVLGAFDLILARDLAAAAPLAALGGRVDGLWDAKLGAPPLPADPAELARMKGLLAGRPVILAASTHRGEEAMILTAFACLGATARARLVVVPRHPDRGPEVADMALGHGFTVARRATGEDGEGARVLVADSLGELGLWYRLARSAVIGGSLVPGVGGHNPFEPARLGCPFAAGPHVDQWPIYRGLVEVGATQFLAGERDLVVWMEEAIAGGPALQAMAAKASDYVRLRDAEGQAVIPRLLDLIG